MWLLRQKIMQPNLPRNHVARPALDAFCDPLRYRITAVHAPGGFGKTTLLAGICRRERAAGRISAWVSLAAADDRDGIVDYLLYAFTAAGLELLEGFASTGDFGDSDRRLNQLVRSIEVHDNPCLLFLDEVDSLDAAAVRVVDWLLQNAPTNLHVALTCRALPRGLDVATSMAQGTGIAVTAEDLRFAPRDIATFFGGELSRRELADLAKQSRGWPIALWIHRNAAGRGADGPLGGSEVAANWFDRRLMRGLSDEVQALVLDAGLFEWLQEDEVDEVLGSGAMRRLRATPSLDGLLQSAGGASGTAYLHPLLRQYCSDRRLRETPERYRSVHRAIAEALGRVGRVVPAVRHAREADEPRLAGEIIERAGGWQLWFRDGVARLHSVNALLSDRIIASHPRLAVLRCMALTMAGETDWARRLLAETRRLEEPSADRVDVNDEIAAGTALCGCMVGFISCAPLGTKGLAETFAMVEKLANADNVDTVTSCAASYAMVAVESARSNLESAAAWARRANALNEPHSKYFTAFVNLFAGMVAMSTGRVAESSAAYARAEALASPGFMRDPGPAMVTDILIAELDLERNRHETLARRVHNIESHLARAGAWLDVLVAAVEVHAELTGRERGPGAAGRVVTEALVFARRTGRTTLLRCLSAMRITDLVAAGRSEEAEQVWTDAAFPERLADCAELVTQTWREMEAVTCAGLRLAVAGARFEEGRELARRSLALCRERRLVRTRLRILALAVVLEHCAGDAGAAAGHLVDCLRIFSRTGYVRPMVKDRRTVLVVLDGLDDTIIADLAPSATELRSVLVGGVAADDSDEAPALNKREHEILKRLEDDQDKTIAAALNLSVAGVRYHVASLFRKLRAGNRRDAVRRARELGLLPSAKDDLPED